MQKSRKSHFTDADCHTLIDLVTNYKNMVQPTGVSFNERIQAWNEITRLYNERVRVPRTTKQLKCKLYCLKKDVSIYEVTKKFGHRNPMKPSTLVLIDKIKRINSVLKEDSDGNTKEKIMRNIPFNFNNKSNVCFVKGEPIEDNFEIVADDNVPETVEINNETDNNVSTSNDPFTESFEILPPQGTYDWSEVHRHNVFKEEMMRREEALHSKKFEMEKILNEEKIKNLRLQNDKLLLEITLLKKKLCTHS